MLGHPAKGDATIQSGTAGAAGGAGGSRRAVGQRVDAAVAACSVGERDDRRGVKEHGWRQEVLLRVQAPADFARRKCVQLNPSAFFSVKSQPYLESHCLFFASTFSE